MALRNRRLTTEPFTVSLVITQPEEHKMFDTMSEIIDMFDDMLNETAEGVFGIDPASIMRKCDAVMYRCALNDYVDSLIDDGQLSSEDWDDLYDSSYLP